MENTDEIKSIFWIGTIVLLLICFGIIFLVIYYQNHFFKIKKMEAELLLRTSLESEKKERHRVAADLHDGVLADLTAIHKFLILLQRGVPDEKKQDLFVELKKGVKGAIENTRLISYKLMPPMLETVGFVSAIDCYFENLSEKSEISFSVVCEDEFLRFSPILGYELFRVVQEFTTNMLKYGNVSSCSVIIYKKDETVFIEIIDDGVPFDFNAMLLKSKGSGINNIDSRLKNIKAELVQRQVVIGNHFVINLKEE